MLRRGIAQSRMKGSLVALDVVSKLEVGKGPNRGAAGYITRNHTLRLDEQGMCQRPWNQTLNWYIGLDLGTMSSQIFARQKLVSTYCAPCYILSSFPIL